MESKFNVNIHWQLVGVVSLVALLIVGIFIIAKPQPQPVLSKAETEMNCSIVKIIYPNIDRNETLLEKVGEGPQLRMLRQGLFGSVGDVFKFCEKAE